MTVSELIADLQQYDKDMKVGRIDQYNYVTEIDEIGLFERGGKTFVRVY